MSRIIVFFGGDSKTGVTMVSRSVAECLGRQRSRVLLLECGGKLEGPFYGNNLKGIDSLKADILSGKASYDDIRQAVEDKKDYSVIRGVRNPYGAKYFPENTIDLICAAAGKDHRHIVIDGGSDIDLGLSVSALNRADRRYYILTQQRNVIARYLYLQKEVLSPLGLTGSIIINKFLKEPSLYRKSEMEQLCKSKGAFTVPYIEYGWQAEAEGKTLMNFPKFAKKIKAVAEDAAGAKG